MYEVFFELKNRPFPSAPSPEFYFPATVIDEAYRTATRCIERAEGPCLVIGPAGTGKSLVCHLLANRFAEAFYVVLLSSAQLCTRRALLQSLLFELNLPYRGLEEGELRLSLIDFLAPERSSRAGMLLLVDETHTLPLRLMEEIRMITNLVREGQPRVRVVMAGSPLLEERFTNPKLESFNQRIAARCYLQSLGSDETARYIQSQLAAAGGHAERIFAADAAQAVHQATDGVPRLINQLCDHALVLAAVAQRRPVDAAVIQEAWADLQQLPTPWQSAVRDAPVDGSVIEFGTLEHDGQGEGDGDPDDAADCERMWDEDTTEMEPVAELSEAENDEPLTAENPEQDDELPTHAGRSARSAVPSVRAGEAEPILAAERCDDPFDDVFAQEEVIVDRYAALAGGGGLAVSCDRAVEAEPRAAEPAEGLAMELPPTRVPADAPCLAVTGYPDGPDFPSAECADGVPEEDDAAEAAPGDEECAAAATLRLPTAEADGLLGIRATARAKVLRVPPDDSDLIVIVDEERPHPHSGAATDRNRRDDLRRLFSRLRER